LAIGQWNSQPILGPTPSPQHLTPRMLILPSFVPVIRFAGVISGQTFFNTITIRLEAADRGEATTLSRAIC
jgi:hypothetical protein